MELINGIFKKNMKYIVIAVLIILFGIFLYWAYLPDYKRNPKEFWRTIIGMPIGMLLGGIGFRNLNEKIRNGQLEKKSKVKLKNKKRFANTVYN